MSEAERPELRDLIDVPRFLGPRPVVARPLSGTTPAGDPVAYDMDGGWTFLLFLSTSCDGCHDLWRAFGGADPPLDTTVRSFLVTRGSEASREVARLAGHGRVVMSDLAFQDYEVSSGPFFVLVDGATGRVATEGVAWSVEQVVSAVRSAQAGV